MNVITVEGVTMLTIFDIMEHPKLEMEAKWNSKTHL
jgi:hypothetical protein